MRSPSDRHQKAMDVISDAHMRRASVPAATAIAVLLAGSYGCHPTDRQLIAGFERHRADYYQLAALAEQDRHLGRVSRTWYETQGGDYHYAPEAGLLSEERWSRYRRLFDVLQLEEGVLIGDGRTWFLRSCFGLSVSGSTKGIAYMPRPTPGCGNADYGPSDVGFEDTCYRHISGKWYWFLWKT